MYVAEINQAREISKRIRELEKQVKALQVSRDNIVPVLDGMPHASEVKSKVERLALRIVEGERELDELRTAFAQAQARIANDVMIQFDDPAMQSLLLLRYVECLSFKDVARRMHYSLRQVFRLQGKIFQHVI